MSCILLLASVRHLAFAIPSGPLACPFLLWLRLSDDDHRNAAGRMLTAHGLPVLLVTYDVLVL